MLVRAHKSAFSWDRSAVLLGVIGLHVGGIYLISVYGGFTRIVETAAGALQVLEFKREEREPPPEPPLERAKLQQAKVFEPQAPVPLDVPGDPEPPGRTITVRVGDGDQGEGRTASVPTVPGTPLTYRPRRSTDDYYPPVSIRMAEEGAAIVRVCVGADGALEGIPQVSDSSGHSRLDAAAVAWAREALTFTPATENGRRVASCKGFRVRFTLRQ